MLIDIARGKGQKIALARTIVCCSASIVAHFARKVSYSASPQFFLDFAPNIAEQKNTMSAQMFRSIYHLFKRPLVYVPFLRTLPLLSYSVKAPSRSPSL